ncbi:MAG: hypothetical protein IPM61_16850 [Chlorobi bacterium]|nr:hypothetical protein [Chlorobiota bacterium]
MTFLQLLNEFFKPRVDSRGNVKVFCCGVNMIEVEVIYRATLHAFAAKMSDGPRLPLGAPLPNIGIDGIAVGVSIFPHVSAPVVR